MAPAYEVLRPASALLRILPTAVHEGFIVVWKSLTVIAWVVVMTLSFIVIFTKFLLVVVVQSTALLLLLIVVRSS